MSTSSQQADEEEAQPECPLCKFIEEGDCKKHHQEWNACRKQAEVEGKDYVEKCAEQWKTFFKCMITNIDYYHPVLAMFGAIEDDGEPDVPRRQTEQDPAQTSQS